VVDLDASPADNVRRLAKAKGVDASAITVLVLDRSRHSDIINGVRGTGAAVRLITDGDVAGVVHCADPENTGVDMYIGTGDAPEGAGGGSVALHWRRDAMPAEHRREARAGPARWVSTIRA
jgi:fructose-1,6-bisphosphatase II / sedoheptulose-1,7-bisphosphatase